MVATSEKYDLFAPVAWAYPFLSSPEWVVSERDRGADPNDDADRFCQEAVYARGAGIQSWTELYKVPTPGEKVTKSITLCRLGPALTGYPGIAHGGSLLTLMDEALAFMMLANNIVETGVMLPRFTAEHWDPLSSPGKPPQEALEGNFVTAKLNVKFMGPVLCPGLVGIEVDLLENLGKKMTIRAAMKDAEGKPLLQVDSLWVKIGASHRL